MRCSVHFRWQFRKMLLLFIYSLMHTLYMKLLLPYDTTLCSSRKKNKYEYSL